MAAEAAGIPWGPGARRQAEPFPLPCFAACVSGERFPLFIGTGIKSGCVLSDRHYWGTVKAFISLIPFFSQRSDGVVKLRFCYERETAPLQSSDFEERGCLLAPRHSGWDRLKTLTPLTACGTLVENRNNAFPVRPGTSYVCYSHLPAQCHLTLTSLQAKLITE